MKCLSNLVMTFGLLISTSSVRSQSIDIDLNAYACESVRENQNQLSVRHIGQVINDQYNEWQEYSSQETPPRLVCIVLLLPVQRELSSDAAKDFVIESLAIGAPANNAPTAEKPSSTDPNADSKFRDAVPMPLPRPIWNTPSQPRERRKGLGGDGKGEIRRRVDGLAVEGTGGLPPPYIHQRSGESYRERAQIIGVEDRIRVSTTQSATFPFNTIGYVAMTYPTGKSFRCSGVLVSRFVVLTAGHCIHNNNEGGFVERVSFSPAQNEVTSFSPTLRPFGSNTTARWVLTTVGWGEKSGPESHPIPDYEFDLGAIQFAQPFTHTSTFMPVVFDAVGQPGHNAGYPGEVRGLYSEGLWSGSGNETFRSRVQFPANDLSLVEFAIDASGGQSGSPFWIINQVTSRRELLGLLSYGDGVNDVAGGPWYTDFNESLVRKWMTWTPDTDTNEATPAPIRVSGLRVPSVFDSSQPTSQSFLRFYNPTNVAGRVEITLADYQTGNPMAIWQSATILPGAATQIDIGSVERAAVGGAISTRGYFSLSIRPNFDGFFQHVLWKRSDGTLTNLTACDAKVSTEPRVLTNVHSSLLEVDYPSTIIIHNTSITSAAVSLGIFDARNGQRLGTYLTPLIPGNAQFIGSVSQIESQSSPRIIPGTGQFHYVVKAETSFTGFMQHLVNNGRVGVITDMTPLCSMKQF
ncbi:MAG: trypsin-like serine protease [Pirellulaceae bacterium]|nr:trypsin-like serine protease [Pirellulaceae bacterium]